MEEYSTFDIIGGMGIKIERLKDWLRRGYIQPSIQVAQGSGTKNLFNRNDLYQLGLFMFLIARGFSREEAAKHAKAGCAVIEPASENEDLEAEKEMKNDGFLMLAYRDGNLFSGGMVRNTGDTITVEADENCDEVLLVNYSKLRREVDGAARRMKPD